ncbi:hypothetical protein GCM10010357_15580 [Streptomyces luteireticuli]|uniref:FXSXX-COOH protein n=1 Tax=Streptomyces luteireticuli TaxID=173858 RepID=A0ABN0YH71_9ACTN
MQLAPSLGSRFLSVQTHSKMPKDPVSGQLLADSLKAVAPSSLSRADTTPVALSQHRPVNHDSSE